MNNSYNVLRYVKLVSLCVRRVFEKVFKLRSNSLRENLRIRRETEEKEVEHWLNSVYRFMPESH